MVLVIGGTLWLTNGTQPDSPPVANGTTEASPSPTAPTSSPDPSEAVDRAVPIYFAGETAVGPRLFREFQREELCPEDPCLWTAAAQGAVNGAPMDPDYTTFWPESTQVTSVAYDGDLITVDIAEAPRERPQGLSEKRADLAVQAVVYSVQGAVGEGRKPVQLLVGGEHTDQVLGVPTAEPLANADPDSTLALVSIDSPAEGAEVNSGFEVTGQAAAFEANVVWELRRGDKVVKGGFTTAAECCTLAPYSFTVDAAPGRYTLVVSDTDASAGEGVGTNEDTKTITIVE
jgi:hypothetical protein